LVEEIEAQLSRFRPDSDISRLNREPSRWLEVGAHTAAVLRAAVELRDLTGGLFDPAMPGRAIEVEGQAGGPARARLGPVRRARPDGIGRNWELGPSGIDLGGIGKGYAADTCLELCRRHGTESALVMVGVSSLAGAGERPGGGPWRIGLRSPGAGPDQSFGLVELAGGGLATSGLDEQRAHIIDPRNGRPADSGLLQATVLAPTAIAAEAYSTALKVGGTAPAAAWPIDSILVTDTAIVVSPGAATRFRINSSQQGAPRAAAFPGLDDPHCSP
jgi:thiamine biosynthesis lipoprotein